MNRLVNWSLDTLSLVSLVVAGTVLGFCAGALFVLSLDDFEGFRDLGFMLNGALAGGAFGLLGAGASFLRLERPARVRVSTVAVVVAFAVALLTLVLLTFFGGR